MKLKNYKHGMYKTRLYSIWASMKERCLNTKDYRYKHYGARGIKVCDEWKNDFKTFYEWAILNGYDEAAPKGEYTLDRIDVNGNYEPSNCRWITLKEQQLNTTKSRLITYKGKTQTIKEWSCELGIKYSTLLTRIDNLKWSIERAFNEKAVVGKNQYYDSEAE